ncbi:signal peptide plus transmembrane domain or GPI anchor [Cryptosporidium felis]|nr:signal peptide plus transmembrane domain or GPI anchor [Cryptosporidium felis]
MNRSPVNNNLFYLVVTLFLIYRVLGESHDLAEDIECKNPDFMFPWGSDYLNACLSFQCHRVRQHKSWYRFWDKRPKFIHKNVNGNEQVIQCADCRGFLKKGVLFGGMSICTPVEFGGDFETPKGWVSLATASLQLNKEIKNKSSVRLTPEKWQINGSKMSSTLDLSKCSLSDDDSLVALSIIVTLTNIADPKNKEPKYRRILGLREDSINARIKTYGMNQDGTFDSEYDDMDDINYEDSQREMVDDESNEYLLYDLNKMASNHIARSTNEKGDVTNKYLKNRKRSSFIGAEKLPSRWKLSKGQTSVYSSSDIIKLELAAELHPNDLVEVVLTCNNRYMNCNIQDFISCFNILCKSVTKEELIRRAALKKARKFISNAIFNGNSQSNMHINNQNVQPGGYFMNSNSFNTGVNQISTHLTNGNKILPYAQNIPTIMVPPTALKSTGFPQKITMQTKEATSALDVNSTGMNTNNVGLLKVPSNAIFPNGMNSNVFVPNIAFSNSSRNLGSLHTNAHTIPQNVTYLNNPVMSIPSQTITNSQPKLIIRPPIVVKPHIHPSFTAISTDNVKLSQPILIQNAIPENRSAVILENNKILQENIKTKPKLVKVAENEPKIIKYIIRKTRSSTKQEPKPNISLKPQEFIQESKPEALKTSASEIHFEDPPEKPKLVRVVLKPREVSPLLIPENTFVTKKVRKGTSEENKPLKVKLIKLRNPEVKYQLENTEVAHSDEKRNIVLQGKTDVSFANEGSAVPVINVLRLKKYEEDPGIEKIIKEKPKVNRELKTIILNKEQFYPQKNIIELVPVGDYRTIRSVKVFKELPSNENILLNELSGSTELIPNDKIKTIFQRKINQSKINPDAISGIIPQDIDLGNKKFTEPGRVLKLIDPNDPSEDDSYISSEGEYSRLILKKVEKNKDILDLENHEGNEVNKTLDRYTESVDTSSKKLVHKGIKGKYDVTNIDCSSISDSYPYEGSCKTSKHNNETKRTGKSIMGYSIMSAVALFTIFIIMKLFLL